MKSVLSIQSHVVYGRAGNSSAVFPMERMGINVWPIHTVQFSNHTQYPMGWSGRVFPAMDIPDLYCGLTRLDVHRELNAMVTGYIGSAEQAESIASLVIKAKAANTELLYVCDPVMGDPDKGCFVPQDITDKLIAYLMPFADVIVPNQYELEQFTNTKIHTKEDAIKACSKALKKGPKMVLVKNLNVTVDCFTMMLAIDGKTYIAERPKPHFDKSPVGVGDLITAVFTANILNGLSPYQALKNTNNSVYGVMQKTLSMGEWEIQTVAAQNEFVEPTYDFEIYEC